MVCVAASGELFELQVLHTAKRPRCLKNTNINQTYDVQYDTSQKGWQNAGTFKRYVRYLDNIARKRKTRFALIVDNASSHVSAAKDLDPEGSQDTYFRLKHMDVLFLPPNCTSDLQPCDMGIIRSFKCKFRKVQLLTVFDLLDHHMISKPADEKFKIEKVIDMKFCLDVLQRSVKDMDENVIRRCWIKSNVLPAGLQAQVNVNVDRSNKINNETDNELHHC